MDIPSQQLEKGVRSALAADRRLPYPREIGVEVFVGAVVLRGTVGSFAQRRAATEDARRTRGVLEVYDQLEVRLLDDDRRADAEIRGEALQRLLSDPILPADWLDVRVRDGWVTLEGEVDSQHQSDVAFEHVATLDGITGVTNELKAIERR